MNTLYIIYNEYIYKPLFMLFLDCFQNNLFTYIKKQIIE